MVGVRRSWLGCVVVALLIGTLGCGSATRQERTGVVAERETDTTREIAHSLEQEAIRVCMAEQGFVYMPTSFSGVLAPESFESQFFLDTDAVDTIGATVGGTGVGGAAGCGTAVAGTAVAGGAGIGVAGAGGPGGVVPFPSHPTPSPSRSNLL